MAFDTADLSQKLRMWLSRTTESVQVSATILQSPNTQLLEFGNRCLAHCGQSESADAYEKNLATAVTLFHQGYDLDWRGLFKHNCYSRISLPTYPFIRDSYWPVGTQRALSAAAPTSSKPLLTDSKMELISNAILTATAEILELEESRISVDEDLQRYGMDSISIARLISRLREQFGDAVNQRSIRELRNIRALARHISELSTPSSGDPVGPIKSVACDSRLPTSAGQRGLWLMQKLNPASTALNISIAVEITEDADLEALEIACQHLLETIPTLSGVYQESEDGVFQVPVPVRMQLLRHACELKFGEPAWVNYVQGLLDKPFDLDAEAPSRFSLVRSMGGRFSLVATIHHSVFDRRSVYPFLRLLAASYRSVLDGKIPSTESGEYTGYEVFAEWEAAYVKGPQANSSRSYWLKQLANLPPPLVLAVARPGTPKQSSKQQFDTTKYRLTDAPKDQLAAMALQLRSTKAVVCLALFKVLLHQYSNSGDIVVGMPTVGRPLDEFQNSIGYFVNMLTIRSQIADSSTFAELCRDLDKTVGIALDHSKLPFSLVVDALGIERQRTVHPVFQIAFEFNNSTLLPQPDTAITQMISSTATIEQKGEFELALEVTDSGTQVEVVLKYNAETYGYDDMNGLLQHYNSLLEFFSHHQRSAISEAPVPPVNDKTECIRHWNETHASFPGHAPLGDLVDEQVDRTPMQVAVSSCTNSLTYQQLKEYSDHIAHRVAQWPAIPDTVDCVAVSMDRSADLVAVLLGVLKSGSAFLPLDPDSPRTRFNYILRDCKPKLVITDRVHYDSVRGMTPAQVAVISVEALLTHNGYEPTGAMSACNPQGPAYIIYTSGTTGQPKGVVVSHRSLINTLYSMLVRPGFNSSDRTFAVSNYWFDVSSLDFFMPLVCGGQCAIASQSAIKDPTLLMEEMERLQPTVMQATPTTLAVLIQAGWVCESGMRVWSTGEALNEQLASRILRGGSELWNLYGPTEAAINVCVSRILDDEPITIGKPNANTEMHILDENLQPVPFGKEGELFIAGEGLALCYLNQRELTVSRFIVAPPELGSRYPRLYRSGDRARQLESGSFQCLGRLDRQIKIRGHRLELEETELALCSFPGITRAVVQLVPGVSMEESRLAAYVYGELTPETFDRAAIFKHLSEALPAYAIPTSINLLPSLPSGSTGKLDAENLVVSPVRTSDDLPPVANSRTVRSEVAALWQQVLPEAGAIPNVSFFQSGGNSLLAVRLASQLRSRFGVSISIAHIFDYPTIAEISAQIEEALSLPLVDVSSHDHNVERRAN
jgi:polyketide synthase PksJ